MLASFLESYLGAYLLRFLISRPRNASISAVPQVYLHGEIQGVRESGDVADERKLDLK